MTTFGFEAAALAFAVSAVFTANPALAQLRAFGEAEGYGAAATGGRAATSVYHVTNLNDSGVGSLRDAVSGQNRIVVFDVSGEIKLTSGGISAQSNITIAGQTAPGAGITVTGAQALGFTQRSNVIVRYLRLRPGDTSSASDNGMSMTRTGTAILDHVSIEFGKYNNIDAVADTADAPRITIQNSIIADPISTGTDDRGQGFGAHLEAVNGYYTLSNNLWANSHSRNPLAKVNEQFKNNIEYNNEIGYLTSGTSTPFKHDLVNNAFIAGPNYTGSSDYGQLSTPDKFYAVGNVQDANQNGVFDGTASNPTGGTSYATPLHAGTSGLPTLSVTDAYAYVLAHAGASLARDTLDQLVVGQVRTLGQGTAGYTAGTTGPTSTVVPFDTAHNGLYWKAYLTGLDNGGLGVTASSSRPAGFDTDNDGIPDAWETAHGMNPAVASDAFKLNPLGYLMVEQYLNELGSTNDSILYTGGQVAAAQSYGLVRGTVTANGTATLASGTTSLMKLSVGGSGPAAGETMTVSGTGNLSVYDTLVVGDQNNAALNITGGTVSAYNVVLGNTVYSPSAVDNVGTLNLSGGTLSLSQLVLGAGSAGAWTRGGSMNFTGGTLKAIGNLNVNVPIATGPAGGTIDTNGFDGVVSGVVSDVPGQAGALTKKGVGTLTLSGANTYTGVTKISAGTLAIAALTNGGVAGNLGAAAATAGNLVLDGGILKYTGTTTTTTDRLISLTQNGGTLDGGGAGQWQFTGTGLATQIGTGNRTLTLTGSTTNSVFASGLGDPTGGKTSLTMAGSGGSARWLLNASATPRTYSGDTTVTAGTLLTNASNVLPFGPGKGNLVITGGTVELNGNNLAINALNGAGTLNQRGSSSRTLTFGYGDASGAFNGIVSNTPLGTQGTLSLVKVGLGTQAFTGANTYAGVTVVQAGTLSMTGPAYTNVINNAGGLDVQGGTFAFAYSGATPLAQVRTLLAIGYANGFSTSQIRETTAVAGEAIYYADTGAAVTLTPALYGDANLDGRVDFNDFLVLQANFGGTNTTTAAADFDYDGLTNFNDFLLLQAHFGQSLTGVAVAVTASQVAAMTAFAQGVPEPTVGLITLAGLTLIGRRRNLVPSPGTPGGG